MIQWTEIFTTIYRRTSPNFEFWCTLLELECLMLMFVHSLKSGNFEKFVEIVAQFLPRMLSLNLTHYARWLPAYIHTLKKLPDQTLKFIKSLKKGDFQFEKHREFFLEYQMIKHMNKIIR